MNDSLSELRRFTQARIGLKRSGHSLSTQELLEFRLAHAAARDAVHTPWNFNGTQAKLRELGEKTVLVTSQIQDRDEYLKRPDRGRCLSEASKVVLQQCRQEGKYEVVFIISDGLSALAVERHFIPLWILLKKILNEVGLSYAPLILAPYSRVALSDDVGFHLNAKAAVILLGERPGLSSSDSLGVYLTYGPKPGNHDSERNCISNIRPPEGLNYESAALQLSFLLNSSLKFQLSGVPLKLEKDEHASFLL